MTFFFAVQLERMQRHREYFYNKLTTQLQDDDTWWAVNSPAQLCRPSCCHHCLEYCRTWGFSVWPLFTEFAAKERLSNTQSLSLKSYITYFKSYHNLGCVVTFHNKNGIPHLVSCSGINRHLTMSLTCWRIIQQVHSIFIIIRKSRLFLKRNLKKNQR